MFVPNVKEEDLDIMINKQKILIIKVHSRSLFVFHNLKVLAIPGRGFNPLT